MHNHHRLFIAGLALLLTGLLFIGPGISLGATLENSDNEIALAPDLTISGMEVVPANPIRGQVTVFKVAVKNLGGTLTSGQGIDNWLAQVQDLTWNPVGVPLLAARQVTSEHPVVMGETIIYTGSGIFGLAGNKTVNLKVDNADELPEIDEDNNSLISTLTVKEPETTPNVTLQIKDLKVTGITPQSAVVLWRTTAASSGKVYYRLFTPTTNDSDQKVGDTWLVAEDKQNRTNHEVKLADLIANKKYQFYVMSAGTNGVDVKSETKDFTTRPLGNVEKPKADDTTPITKPVDKDKIGPLPKQPLEPDEVLQLRERVKKLQLRISELETKLLEREKFLAQPKDEKLTNQVKGKIVLDVEKDKGGNGEAWYVDPITAERYYLKDGDTAYQAMQAFGLGISSADLQKIPIAIDPKLVEKDTDGDGLSDDLEETVGSSTTVADTDGDGYKDGEEVQNQYSPTSKEKMPIDKVLCQRLKGRVVIDVQNKGRAWYIDPDTCQRYYLRNGDQAYKIMRYRSTGISRDNLNKLEVGDLTTSQ